ncbi:hypothetical protein APR41_04465 [Salegentibacter salinarum]|uniref:DUF6850 domain-containing protein n=2 Tax=Salegentibacter salinarum TaxID=447422 RepID=A0A2N0TUJ3_9FLAO|nr:hypothetical protein APR41_04465 [Salegentibacter salinarum]
MACVPLKDYTASTLYYHFEEGALKQGGEPQGVQDFGLKTQGIYRTGMGITFFGDLLVKKTYYRDLAWNLSYMMPKKGMMPDPHYFGVSKPGNWSNQHYELNGGVVIPVNQGWNLALETNYNLFNKYRVNLDPRPKITYNKLTLGANLSYNITKNHRFNMGYAFEQAAIINNINFSNNNQNEAVNYDIYIKWIAGYGSLMNVFEEDIKRKNKAQNFSLGYTFQNSSHQLLVTANLKRGENITFKEDVDDRVDNENSYFATFEPEAFQLDIMGLKYKGKGKLIKAEYTYHRNLGENFLTAKGGKTYSNSLDEHMLSYSHIQQDAQGSTKNEYGLKFQYWESSQQDALAVTRSDFKNGEIHFYGQKVVFETKKIKLRPQLRTSIIFNIEENLENGNSQYLENIDEYDYMGFSLRDYYNQVIMPDLQLVSSTRINLEAGAYLDFISRQNLQSILNLKIGYLSSLESDNYHANNQRLYTSLSLILNY